MPNLNFGAIVATFLLAAFAGLSIAGGIYVLLDIQHPLRFAGGVGGILFGLAGLSALNAIAKGDI